MTKREPTKLTLATRAFAKIARTSQKIQHADDVFARAEARHTETIKRLHEEATYAHEELAELGFPGIATCDPEPSE